MGTIGKAVLPGCYLILSLLPSQSEAGGRVFFRSRTATFHHPTVRYAGDFEYTKREIIRLAKEKQRYIYAQQKRQSELQELLTLAQTLGVGQYGGNQFGYSVPIQQSAGMPLAVSRQVNHASGFYHQPAFPYQAQPSGYVQQPPAQSQPAAQAIVEADSPITDGASLVLQKCTRCHQVGGEAESLTMLGSDGQLIAKLPRQKMLRYAMPGSPKPMPPSSPLTDEELNQLAAWALPPDNLEY